MAQNTPMNFELLKLAMENRKYLNEINSTKENREQFLNELATNQITCLQIIELIKIVKNKSIKSLLITFLLSQKEYVDNLKGESILSQTDNNEVHIPSRLNALVHQLDVKNLTLEHIAALQPESAVSILYSVPLFHQLTEEQVDALIKQYPQPAVLIYWLNHFVTMPNAHFMLAHLMKLADSHIITELNKMDSAKREIIITGIIEHLELFKPIPKILYEGSEEQHLIKAIHLYLNGQQHEHYVAYIKRLTERLLHKNHSLSPEAIQLLISLNGNHEFTSLNNKTGYLMNHYLRVKAHSGEVELFYTAGKINILSMTQPVQLTPPLPPVAQPAPEKGFLDTWLSPPTKEDTQPARIWNNIPEKPIIKELAMRKKSVKSFDYFLMHYKGDSKKISNVIRDYLDFHIQEGCTENRRLTLHHLSILMTWPEVSTPIREAIHTAFLDYPDLYDEQISYCMLVFDAKKTIQYFGMQSSAENYNHVLNLCSWALKRLDPKKHENIISIVTQAQSEAKIELNFQEEKGFFARLFERFKRCWIYGWSGFFSPNLPVYVSPAYLEKVNSTEPVLPSEQNETVAAYKPKANLSSLLMELETKSTLQKLDELIEVLGTFSFKANPKDELTIRYKINKLFHELLVDSSHEVNNWLIKNQHLLIANRFHLIELVMIKDNQDELESLIKQIREDSTHLQLLMNEFTPVFPELQENKTTIIDNTTPIPPVNVVETATVLVSDAWKWTKNGVWGLFAAPDTSDTSVISNPEETIQPETL